VSLSIRRDAEILIPQLSLCKKLLDYFGNQSSDFS
jgi:hypothetical protein